MTDPVSGSVRIGTYALEVGAFTESYAAFEPEREDRNVKALRDALAEEPDEVHTPVAALEKLQANAETVTRKCERAHELSQAAAEGRLLEADALMAESTRCSAWPSGSIVTAASTRNCGCCGRFTASWSSYAAGSI